MPVDNLPGEVICGELLLVSAPFCGKARLIKRPHVATLMFI